jgi:hypothetical protein
LSKQKLLLEKNIWTEEPVKDLVNVLTSNLANWNVLAFRQPDIYLQYSKKYNYKSIWHISHMNNVLKKKDQICG